MENNGTRDYKFVFTRFMEVLIKGGYGIVNCNPRCTFCPLEPKQDTFYVTDGSPMFGPLSKNLMEYEYLFRKVKTSLTALKF